MYIYISYYIALYYGVLSFIILWYVMLYYIIKYHKISYHIIYYILYIIYYIILSYLSLYYTVWYYIKTIIKRNVMVLSHMYHALTAFWPHHVPACWYLALKGASSSPTEASSFRASCNRAFEASSWRGQLKWWEKWMENAVSLKKMIRLLWIFMDVPHLWESAGNWPIKNDWRSDFNIKNEVYRWMMHGVYGHISHRIIFGTRAPIFWDKRVC